MEARNAWRRSRRSPAPTRCAARPSNGAYLTFDEDKKGSLEAGKLADLAVLSADPLTVEEGRLAEIRSLMTMVGGRMVHETPNWGSQTHVAGSATTK